MGTWDHLRIFSIIESRWLLEISVMKNCVAKRKVLLLWIDEVRTAFIILPRQVLFLNRVGLDGISGSYLEVIRNFADTALNLGLGKFYHLGNHACLGLLQFSLFKIAYRCLSWRVRPVAFLVPNLRGSLGVSLTWRSYKFIRRFFPKISRYSSLNHHLGMRLFWRLKNLCTLLCFHNQIGSFYLRHFVVCSLNPLQLRVQFVLWK